MDALVFIVGGICLVAVCVCVRVCVWGGGKGKGGIDGGEGGQGTYLAAVVSLVEAAERVVGMMVIYVEGVEARGDEMLW